MHFQFVLSAILVSVIIIAVVVVLIFRSPRQEETLTQTNPTNEVGEKIYVYREFSQPYPVIDYCAEYEETDTNISFECHRQLWYEAGCKASPEFFRSGHEEGGWPSQQTLATLRQDKINWYNNAVAQITEPWDYSETCFGYPAGTF